MKNLKPKKSFALNFLKIAQIIFITVLCAITYINSEFDKKIIKTGKEIDSIQLLEKTLAIIKPDAVKAKNTGDIIKIIELNNFKIDSIKKILLTKNQAETFYDIHKKKPFFKDLVAYITSSPIVVLVLEKENGVQAWRDLMGSTNPQNANLGTIRKMFGTSIQNNAVHGSDSAANAQKERDFFSKL